MVARRTVGFLIVVSLGGGCADRRDGVPVRDAGPTVPDAAVADAALEDAGMPVDVSMIPIVIGVSAITGVCPGSVGLYGHELLFIDGAPADELEEPIATASFYVVPPGVHELTMSYDAAGCSDTFFSQSLTFVGRDRHVLVNRGSAPGGETVMVSNLFGRYDPLPDRIVLVHASSTVGSVSWTMVDAGGAPAGNGALAQGAIGAAMVPATGTTTIAFTDDSTGAVYEATAVPLPGDVVMRACVLRDPDEGSPRIDCAGMGRFL
jgi:hypothetical protein